MDGRAKSDFGIPEILFPLKKPPFSKNRDSSPLDVLKQETGQIFQ
jgi:hypothetical protein